MLLLFLLLYFVFVAAPVVEEDEGIMVSFGNTDMGGSNEQEYAMSEPTQSVAPPVQAQAPSDNQLLTQDDEESLALAQQRKQEDKRRAEEQERIRRQKEAEAKAEAERIAKEQALAAERAKQQQAIERAGQLKGLFGNNTATSQGSGDTQGDTAKGNPVGKGTSGGNSWSLNGRELKNHLSKPDAPGNQEGTVVVEIRVNAAGKVISAVAKGGNISETETRRAAEKEAYKAVFSAGKTDVVGEIVYKFTNK
ncbi:MAG: hypothetical protein NC038_01065 [Paludibacter sp.]|nr:hypothetical protein [Bacteroidales bacterium]MCM1069868.1 hypothetical protein [Prevotella sp.]MCM1353059.1 hypothetical protein [Bacteroides sp.]MCM1443416.1 hypothetical protein [Muribaculum sp.]MCM1481224.1 hypothetical protein [Paludibacter sp.]